MINVLRNKFESLDSHTKEVLIKISSSTLIKIIGIVTSVIISVIIGRSLGPEGLGIINLATQIASVLMIISLLGIPQYLIRELSVKIHRKEWSDVQGLINSSLYIVGVFSVIIIFFFLIFIPWFSESLFNEIRLISPLYIISISVFFQVLSRIFGSGLIGFKKIWQSNLVNESLSLIIVLGLIFVYYILGHEFDIETIAWFYLVGRLGVTIFTAIYWKYLFRNFNRVKYKFIGKKLIHDSLPFLLVSGMAILASNVDVVMIGWLSDINEVGFYTVASKLALLNVFFLQVANSSLSPKIATLYSENKIIELNILVQKVTHILIFIALLPLIIFFFFGNFFLNIWGNEFISGYWVLIILSIGQVFNIGTGPAGLVLIMTGFEKIQARISFISIILNLAFNIFLIGLLGAMGAAIATSIAIIFENIAKIVFAYKLTGVSTISFIKLK